VQAIKEGKAEGKVSATKDEHGQLQIPPSVKTWLSVRTPSVFRQYELPVDEREWSILDHKKYRELRKLAERFGTNIRWSYHRDQCEGCWG
jgi:hypothetical protein